MGRGRAPEPVGLDATGRREVTAHFNSDWSIAGRVVETQGDVVVLAGLEAVYGEPPWREASGRDARTPEAAYEKLGCEPQCGCCLDYAQEIIDEELGKGPSLRVVA